MMIAARIGIHTLVLENRKVPNKRMHATCEDARACMAVVRFHQIV